MLLIGWCSKRHPQRSRRPDAARSVRITLHGCGHGTLGMPGPDELDAYWPNSSRSCRAGAPATRARSDRPPNHDSPTSPRIRPADAGLLAARGELYSGHTNRATGYCSWDVVRRIERHVDAGGRGHPDLTSDQRNRSRYAFDTARIISRIAWRSPVSRVLCMGVRHRGAEPVHARPRREEIGTCFAWEERLVFPWRMLPGGAL